MKKILNERLQTLSAFIEDGEVVLDIGCDHGLLGIYLSLNRNNIHVISSDINKKPLNKAKENIHKYHLDDKIDLRLGDGLSVVSDDIKTIIISGMGTETIINILKSINNYSNINKLVLSPNNDFPLLREHICKLGFYITKEEIVLENNKYYLISEFKRGYNKCDYYFGKLNLKDAIVRKYYQYIYDKNRQIFSNLSLKNKLKKISLLKENWRIKKIVFDK